jgi:uncharacterized protein
LNKETTMTASPLQRPSDTQPPLPWWRFGMAWFVIGLPLLVAVASLVTGAIAWRHADIQVYDPPVQLRQSATGAGAIAGTPAPTSGGPLEPAQQARNHAATPKP